MAEHIKVKAQIGYASYKIPSELEYVTSTYQNARTAFSVGNKHNNVYVRKTEDIPRAVVYLIPLDVTNISDSNFSFNVQPIDNDTFAVRGLQMHAGDTLTATASTFTPGGILEFTTEGRLTFEHTSSFTCSWSAYETQPFILLIDNTYYCLAIDYILWSHGFTSPGRKVTSGYTVKIVNGSNTLEWIPSDIKPTYLEIKNPVTILNNLTFITLYEYEPNSSSGRFEPARMTWNYGLKVPLIAGLNNEKGISHLQVKVPIKTANLTTAKDKLFLTSREKIFNLKANATANCRLYAKIKKNKPQKSITGKTWVANRTVSLPQTAKNYNIDFYYYGVDAQTKRTSPSLAVSSTGITYGASTDYAAYSAYNTAWADTFCDVISITGGADATNSELIDFLESNGRLVDTLETLVNTSWVFLPSTQIQPFSADDTALYAINSITTTNKFQIAGEYILYYGKSMYLPVTYSGGQVDLANGTNIWSDNANKSNWWYRRSDMEAQQYKNLNMQPIVQISGGSSAAVLRVINYFQKNATLFDGAFIDAGTYKWVEAPDIKSIYKTDDTIYVLNFRCDWHDVANDKNYTNKEFTGINIKLVNGVYWLYFVDPDNAYCYAGYISTNPSMDGRVSNPIINLKSPADADFKNWFLANTTKI